MTSVADNIVKELQQLHPSHVDLVNESMNHAGYFEGKESHFKLAIVAETFEGKRMVARHQQIYALLADYLTANGGSVHALALHTYTPTEWSDMTSSLESPKCAGQTKAI